MKLTTYLFAFLMFAFISCKDECKDLNCNFGTCDDGTCICDDGFEGTNCDAEQRTKFIGVWAGIINCASESTQIVVNITKNSSQIRLVNLSLDGDTTVIGHVNGKTITIDQQTPGEDIILSGSASISSDNSLSLELVVLNNGDGEMFDCSFTGTK